MLVDNLISVGGRLHDRRILDQRGGLLGLSIMVAGTDVPGRLRSLLPEIVCQKTPGRCAGRAETLSRCQSKQPKRRAKLREGVRRQRRTARTRPAVHPG